MSPYQKAMLAFNDQRRPDTFTFDDAMGWHFNHGFVHSTPDYFIMGRAVDSKAPFSEVVDYAHTFPPTDCDAWHVALAAGNLKAAWAVLPYPLPLIGFDRKGELRFYPLHQVCLFTGGPS